MNIEKYYSLDGSKLSFTRQQGSDFAKTVAGDFNPLHNVDTTRFCIPGDLLFAVIIRHYGLHQIMGLSFSGMVNDYVTLYLPEVNAREISIYDEKNKKYLDISTNGELTRDSRLIDSLTRSYVEFSGHSFPDLLVPMMKEKKIMINTERPLVLYDHMRISLDTLDIDEVALEFASNEFRIYGKRGDVVLNFNLTSNGKVIGRGQKKMVVSGLREYVQEKIDILVDAYNERKRKYREAAITL